MGLSMMTVVVMTIKVALAMVVVEMVVVVEVVGVDGMRTVSSTHLCTFMLTSPLCLLCHLLFAPPRAMQSAVRLRGIICAVHPRLPACPWVFATHCACAASSVLPPFPPAPQAMQPAVRLLLLLARIGDRVATQQQQQQQQQQLQASMTCPSAIQSDTHAQHTAASWAALSTTVAVVDAALAVLTLSPPGACAHACMHACVRVCVCVCVCVCVSCVCSRMRVCERAGQRGLGWLGHPWKGHPWKVGPPRGRGCHGLS